MDSKEVMDITLFEKKRTTSGQKALTKPQVRDLLQAVTDVEDQALLTLAVYTGIRRSDIVRIERKNIDFGKLEILFYESKKKGFHKVFINSRVEKALKMWVNRSKSRWLFPSRFKKRGHMCGKTAYNIFQRTLKAGGLPSRPFHALRATCVKLHQAAGLTPEQTARIINDSISVVQKHYSTPSDEEMKKAISEVDIL